LYCPLPSFKKMRNVNDFCADEQNQGRVLWCGCKGGVSMMDQLTFCVCHSHLLYFSTLTLTEDFSILSRWKTLTSTHTHIHIERWITLGTPDQRQIASSEKCALSLILILVRRRRLADFSVKVSQQLPCPWVCLKYFTTALLFL